MKTDFDMVKVRFFIFNTGNTQKMLVIFFAFVMCKVQR